jgi:serine/threonine protein kinase
MIHKHSYKKRRSYKKHMSSRRKMNKKYQFGGSGDLIKFVKPQLGNITRTDKITYDGNDFILDGTGGFGSVYINIEKNEAIKIINTPRGMNEIVSYYNISTLVCNNDYFCKFKNYYYDETIPKMYILMEYCGKSLLSVINNNRNKLLKKLVYRWFLNIAKGMQCMHTKGYVHLDIKLSNITIYGNDDLNHCQSKLIDFGFAKKIDEIKPNEIYYTGTSEYMAPELSDRSIVITDYTKCDIYSFGAALGRALIWGVNEKCDALIEHCKPLEHTSSDDPLQRPTIEYIIDELTKFISVD